MKGTVFDIKEFTVHDGPGIRTTVFLKGCPLRCIWCHNPEGLSRAPQLMITKNGCHGCGLCQQPCDHPDCAEFDRCLHVCPKGLIKLAGYEIQADELANELKKNEAFFISSGGGVTVSGGEPLMQPQFLRELLISLSPLHRLLETSGYAEPQVFADILPHCDHVYIDLKHPDSAEHERVTGVGNEKIIANLKKLADSGTPYTVRIPLIPGINDAPETLKASAELIAGLKNPPERVELMPYNTFAGAKYQMTDIPFKYEQPYENDLEAVPTEYFNALGLKVKIL